MVRSTMARLHLAAAAVCVCVASASLPVVASEPVESTTPEVSEDMEGEGWEEEMEEMEDVEMAVEEDMESGGWWRRLAWNGYSSRRRAAQTPASATSMVCNGNAMFCDLRIDQYTFAGSHNAGSYDFRDVDYTGGNVVTNVIDWLDSKTVKVQGSLTECMFENHNRSLLEQVQLGIRFLDMRMCVEGDTLVSCTRANGMTGMSKSSVVDDLAKLSQFMESNKEDVIVMRSDQTSAKGRTLEKALVTEAFGPDVLFTEKNITNVETGDYPTLRDIVNSGKRVIVIADWATTEWFRPSDAYGRADGSPGEVANIVSKPSLNGVANETVLLQISKWGAPSGWTNWDPTDLTICVDHIADKLSDIFYKEDAGCMLFCEDVPRYTSRMEDVWKSYMNSEIYIGVVTVDYPTKAFTDTINRVNELNARYSQVQNVEAAAIVPKTFTKSTAFGIIVIAAIVLLVLIAVGACMWRRCRGGKFSKSQQPPLPTTRPPPLAPNFAAPPPPQFQPQTFQFQPQTGNGDYRNTGVQNTMPAQPFV